MRSGRSCVVALLALATCATAGCGEEKSYAVVTVRTTTGEIRSIAQFRAYLFNNGRMDLLYYPHSTTGDFRITAEESMDFSVSFAGDRTGDLTIGVQAIDRNGVNLGYGQNNKAIDPRHVISLGVSLEPGRPTPVFGADGGTPPPPPDGGAADGPPDDGQLPHTGCEPANPAAMCTARQTCLFQCGSTGMNSAGTCTAAGAGKDGDPCFMTADCEPGTQCLELLACGAKVCQRYCRTNADCPSGTCTNRVSCMGKPTQYSTCALDCDPRGDGTSICKAGLRCLLFTGEITRCDCATTRTKAEGEACDNLTSCQPGLICIGAPNQVCRKICKLSEPTTCAAGEMCQQLLNPRYETWGACLRM